MKRLYKYKGSIGTGTTSTEELPFKGIIEIRAKNKQKAKRKLAKWIAKDYAVAVDRIVGLKLKRVPSI